MELPDGAGSAQVPTSHHVCIETRLIDDDLQLFRGDVRRVSSFGGSNSFGVVLCETLGLDSAHVVRSCLWVPFGGGVMAAERGKLLTGPSALYVIRGGAESRP